MSESFILKQILMILFIFTLDLGLMTSSPALAIDSLTELENTSVEDFEKELTNKEGLSKSEKDQLNSNKLDIGGTLRHDINIYSLKNTSASDHLLTPTTLGLYLDSKLKEDVRGFFRGQFIYDGSVDTGTASNRNNSSMTQTQLEEMKIQFPIEKTLFVTLGMQKIKWGSGHFWNPTDFLNLEAKDLLETEDRRAGRNLVKLHWPYEALNFYVIGDFTEADESKKMGTAIRAEIPFSNTITSGELSLSHSQKGGRAHHSGVDLSMAVGPIDVLFEIAPALRDQTASSVLGVSYDWQYSDDDLMTLILEIYHNEAGATSETEYSALFAQQLFVPFHIAQTYHLLSLYLPNPGRWNHSTISVLFIENAVDISTYNRIGYTWSGMKDLTLSFYAGLRTGDEQTEMRWGGLSKDYSFQTEIKF